MDESKVTVVYPQLNTKYIAKDAAAQPLVPPFRSADPGLRITVVGRLADSKGQWRAIDAIGLLEKSGIRASLCLVGSWVDPDYDIKLMRRARELGVADRVTIVGEQANPFPYVAAADVCVTPSSIEAFGRTTLEAMVLGKPVVASSRGGSAELIVPGETGQLFDPTDTDDLARHLAAYAKDPALAVAHGEAAQRRAGEIMSHDYSNAAAIERLKHTATMPAYQLPNIARYWFSLPGHYFSVHRAPRITVGFILTRLAGRTRNFFVQPLSAVRRRLEF
jgi:glycosyltransferase involved in cell wall biosynthesis